MKLLGFFVRKIKEKEAETVEIFLKFYHPDGKLFRQVITDAPIVYKDDTIYVCPRPYSLDIPLGKYNTYVDIGLICIGLTDFPDIEKPISSEHLVIPPGGVVVIEPQEEPNKEISALMTVK